MITEDLAGELSKEQIAYELVAHRHTEHARDEAAALGVSQEEVGKTLILTSGSGYIRAVIPASERLDLHKVREHVASGGETHLATERELVGAYPGFELGAVPPFGGPPGDRVLAVSIGSFGDRFAKSTIPRDVTAGWPKLSQTRDVSAWSSRSS